MHQIIGKFTDQTHQNIQLLYAQLSQIYHAPCDVKRVLSRYSMQKAKPAYYSFNMKNASHVKSSEYDEMLTKAIICRYYPIIRYIFERNLINDQILEMCIHLLNIYRPMQPGILVRREHRRPSHHIIHDELRIIQLLRKYETLRGSSAGWIIIEVHKNINPKTPMLIRRYIAWPAKLAPRGRPKA